jgi:hypothetical protein
VHLKDLPRFAVPFLLRPDTRIFILAVLGEASSSFLPGISAMWDSSMGPMAMMVISIVVGVFIFPVAGALWFSKYKDEKKTRLVVTSLLIHTVIAYAFLVLVTIEEPGV